ncbi:hypothetical protein L2E82_01602 [Cichorium intybus]|uniref:Uncharacterized protein n=1 Tax=Cichorium intybus TaxID=13427 RepID=A0ACB9GZG2_CICIN|nr:hypothetical protein L2E82_01602 [Cichorium intybus]
MPSSTPSMSPPLCFSLPAFSIEQRRVQIDPETIKIMRKAVVDLIPRTEIYGVCVCICEIKTGIESPSGLEGHLTAILLSIPSLHPRPESTIIAILNISKRNSSGISDVYDQCIFAFRSMDDNAIAGNLDPLKKYVLTTKGYICFRLLGSPSKYAIAGKLDP